MAIPMTCNELKQDQEEELINILKHRQCVRNKITKINTRNLFIPQKMIKKGKFDLKIQGTLVTLCCIIM